MKQKAKIDIYEAIVMASDAWDSVDPKTIENCFEGAFNNDPYVDQEKAKEPEEELYINQIGTHLEMETVGDLLEVSKQDLCEVESLDSLIGAFKKETEEKLEELDSMGDTSKEENEIKTFKHWKL